MEIKKIGEKNNVVRISVKGTDTVMMNAVRRAIMTCVPTLAVEDVAAYENSSVLFDEYLAHRLAMIPIKTDSKRYKKGDKVRMTLEKEGPCMVYSRDIKSTDPKVEVVSKGIPLVKLNKKQKVKMEMDAVMGTGKEHAKWQPANVGYSEDGQNAFTLTIESHGNLSVKEILLGAVGALAEKNKEFCSLAKKI